MDTPTDPRARLYRLRTHPTLLGETRITYVREALAAKSPIWNLIQTDPFALVERADDIPF